MKRLLTALTLALCALLAQPSHATIALDGEAGVQSLFSVTLTTTSPNPDLIWACFEVNGGPILSVSGSTLGAFTFRSSSQFATAFPIECWYKVASSAVTGEVISAVASDPLQFSAAIAFGISGADTSSPFDGGPFVMPADTVDLSFTTSGSPRFCFAAYRVNVSTPTPGTGYTQIGATVNSFQLGEYQIFASNQTGTAATIGTGAGTANGGVGDCIKEAGGPPPPASGNHSLGLMGVGN